jgi:hypothetical protein
LRVVRGQVVASLFKWGTRGPHATEDAVVAPADNAGTVAASKVLPRFLSTLSMRPTPVLLDLGPVVGPNIAFFGDQFACKIHVADLFAEVESHARAASREGLADAMDARIQHGPSSIDGILCWDLFDFLDRAAGQRLASRLTGLLRPGGVLYGFFGASQANLTSYTRFVVEAVNTLRLRPSPATVTSRTVWTTRDINRMFEGLAVAESVLLKTSTRETLFRKPQE